MRFLPREEKFFGLFIDQVNIISKCADLLLQGTRSGGVGMADAAQKIRVLEGEGDEIIHRVFTLLNHTFITPLDPEDIHTLASHLDDVLDSMEDAAHRLVSYRVDPIPPAMAEVSEHVVACCRSLHLAFEALNSNQKLIDHCIEINRIEEVVDTLVRQQVQDLFDHEKDPIQIMKLKEIYELLEKTTDDCEDVADALQNVVVKNS